MKPINQAEYYYFKKVKDIDDYTKALILKPDLVEAYINRGCSYFDIHEYNKAIVDFTEAIRLNPDLVESYINRGCSYFNISEYINAIVDFTETIRLNPDLVESYINRGCSYFYVKNYDEAYNDFTYAIRLNPDANSYFLRSILFYKMKKYTESTKDYKEAIRLNPEYKNNEYNRAIAHGDIKMISKTSVHYIETSSKVVPNETNDTKTKSTVKPTTEIKIEPTLPLSEHTKTQVQKNNETIEKKEVLEKKRILEYKKMKIFATSIFFLMVVVFIISHIFENQLTILPYIKAFSEAAMIGALADWFAVVALFRKPLGFPYHTAIIPNNKDKMGESMGRLIQDNFLTPERIMEDFKDIDFVKEGISLLIEEKKRILQFIYHLIPKLLDDIDKEEVKNAIIKKIQEIKFAKVISDIFELFTNENKHQDVLHLALDAIQNFIFTNKSKIISKIREYKILWIHIPEFFAIKIADAIIDFLNNEFIDIKNDPSHMIRKELNSFISNVGRELKENSDWQKTIDEKIKSVILNKTVLKYFDSMWLEFKKNIEEDLNSKDSRIKNWINSAFYNFVEYLEKNVELSKEIDEGVRRLIKNKLIERKDRISEMISKKVKDTPKQEISDLIESYVGKDLQYIRINGTIVGGLVGLLIFFITKIL